MTFFIFQGNQAANNFAIFETMYPMNFLHNFI